MTTLWRPVRVEYSFFEARSDDFGPGDDFRQTRFLVAVVRAMATATTLEYSQIDCLAGSCWYIALY